MMTARGLRAQKRSVSRIRVADGEPQRALKEIERRGQIVDEQHRVSYRYRTGPLIDLSAPIDPADDSRSIDVLRIGRYRATPCEAKHMRHAIGIGGTQFASGIGRGTDAQAPSDVSKRRIIRNTPADLAEGRAPLHCGRQGRVESV